MGINIGRVIDWSNLFFAPALATLYAHDIYVGVPVSGLAWFWVFLGLFYSALSSLKALAGADT